MKVLLSLLISILLSTKAYAVTPNQQALIDKSYGGDVSAILELGNKHELYKSVDGFYHFKEWYSIVLESANGDDIFAFSEIYDKYMKQDINGAPRYLQLLTRAAELNNVKAIILLTRIYLNLEKSDYNGEIYSHFIETVNVLEYTFFYNKEKLYLKDEEPLDRLHEQLLKIGTKKEMEAMLDFYSNNLSLKDKPLLRIFDLEVALKTESYQIEGVPQKLETIPPVRYYDSNKSFGEKIYSEKFGRQSVSSIVYNYNLNKYDDALRNAVLKAGDVGTALAIADFYPSVNWPPSIKSIIQSIAFYDELVDQESVLAMLALGDLYYSASNFDRKIRKNVIDFDKAAFYYTKAAEFGSEKARIRLKEINQR